VGKGPSQPLNEPRIGRAARVQRTGNANIREMIMMSGGGRGTVKYRVRPRAPRTGARQKGNRDAGNDGLVLGLLWSANKANLQVHGESSHGTCTGYAFC
jgi:hypothetical protein